METIFRTFIPATDRIGIIEAVATIIDRHKRSEYTTSIVLPPRYGKSDVIRLSATELLETGETCAALVLAPWTFIAEQLVDEKRIKTMINRYFKPRLPKTPKTFRSGKLTAIKDNFHETTHKQHLFTSTIQLAKSQIYFFEKWLERCNYYAPTVRPIIYIDEGHLLNKTNEWGKIAEITSKYRAHLVLLTGTKHRADSKPIPGFTVRKMNETDVEKIISHRINDEQILQSKYSGIMTEQILIADHETPIAEAWACKALCKVTSKWFDVTVTENGEEKQLSELKPTEVRKHLRNALMEFKTIKEMMEAAILDMKQNHKAGYKTRILVVTTSDISLNNEDYEDDSASVNFHARKVRNVVKTINPDLKVMIATQASRDDGGDKNSGANRLKRFVEDGEGDILVVKNMGTVGLDCGDIKTVVVLGTIRQLASWIQMILRGATTYKDMTHYTLILTKDILNVQNYNLIVKGNGGDEPQRMTVLTKESETIINKPKEENEYNLDVLNAMYKETQDSHNDNIIYDETDVNRLLEAMPGLRGPYSNVELQDMLDRGVINIDAIYQAKNDDDVNVVNTGKECVRLSAELNEKAKEYASLFYMYNRNGNKDVNKQWQIVKSKVTSEAKRHAGITVPTGKENDPVKLKNAIAYIDRLMEAKHAA